MFVYDFTVVDHPFEQANRRLLREEDRLPSLWSAAFLRATGPTNGSSAARPPVELRVGPARDRGDGICIPLAGTTAGPHGPLTSLDGDLELAPLEARQAHLSLAGYWAPADRHAGGWRSRQQLRHRTELCVRSFLRAVAWTLEGDA